MKKNINKYEFMLIIKPFLPEDVRIKLLKNIKEMISSLRGKILKEDIWGKRHLAYNIQGHGEGYYVIYDFEMQCDKIANIEEELRMTNDLLRYIIIKED